MNIPLIFPVWLIDPVFEPGGELLPGHESDRRHLAHVPE